MRESNIFFVHASFRASTKEKELANMSDRAKAYTQAGVDLDKANSLVSRLKNIVSTTHTKGVVSEVGGFGGLFKPDLSGMKEPVLVSATDGVGTKLKLAFAFDKHMTVGIDLVAMNVNDILVQGAKPLFFLDYFATGALDVDKAEEVIKGIAAGCWDAGCALLGGETAEMPDMYPPGEYDLAGFCVGIVDMEKIVEGTSVRKGDVIIGLASSGLHSNGFSLARKVLERSGLQGDDTFPGTDKPVWEVLLEPTAIYVKTVLNLLRNFDINGMAHITGGGFYDNIPRVLPKGLQAEIDFGTWDMPPVFQWIKDTDNLSWPEMLQIFNCGVGYVLVVDQETANEVMDRLAGLKQEAWIIGRVGKRASRNSEQVVVKFPEEGEE
jgi:phosphoribosylformylglycinamidine cyclo-ligase